MTDTWNYQIEPIRPEEIPDCIRDYIMMDSFDLEIQPWKNGLRYLAGKCKYCREAYGSAVGETRMMFKRYNCRADNIVIICKACKEEEERREIEAAGLLKEV